MYEHSYEDHGWRSMETVYDPKTQLCCASDPIDWIEPFPRVSRMNVAYICCTYKLYHSGEGICCNYYDEYDAPFGTPFDVGIYHPNLTECKARLGCCGVQVFNLDTEMCCGRIVSINPDHKPYLECCGMHSVYNTKSQ